MYLRTVLRSSPVWRAMAETFSPCRWSSRIITSSPRVTTALLPPANGNSIGEEGAAGPPGSMPRGERHHENWGKFQAHKWGVFNARSTIAGLSRELQVGDEGNALLCADLEAFVDGQAD